MGTTSGSMARRLMVNLYVVHAIPRWLPDGQSNPEFLLDLGRKFLELREASAVEGKGIVEPSLNNRDYHEQDRHRSHDGATLSGKRKREMDDLDAGSEGGVGRDNGSGDEA